jgi:GR25 family glycosyltransferase involved in LPS biosynthesis
MFTIFLIYNKDDISIYINTSVGKIVSIILVAICLYVNVWIGFLVGILILYIFALFHYTNKRIHGYFINLDKNTIRRHHTVAQIDNTDLLPEIEVNRFSAINGKSIELSKYLKPETVDEINVVEVNGKRTHHHQLTRGAVGCFLSHFTLYKQLLKDSEYGEYLIMEDDITISKNLKWHIYHSLSQVPEDWDMILYGYVRMNSTKIPNRSVEKVNHFWGTQGYLINRRGAEKIVMELDETSIDGQIDSYLSRMIKQNKLNVYVYKKVIYGNSMETDIQIPLTYSTTIDPFDYKGYLMR